MMGNGRKWVHGFSVQVFGAWILYSIVQKPGLLEKADEMLPAIQGTLVPLQFRFLEGDLENLRKPTSPSDVRFYIPEIIVLRLRPSVDLRWITP